MSCEERKDLMLLYVAGALDDAERAALESHLQAGCPRCAGHLAEARAVVDHLPLALEPVAPSPSVRRKLIERVSADAAGATEASAARETTVRRGSPRPSFFATWLSPAIAAGLAVVVTYFGVNYALRQQQQELADRETKMVAWREEAQLTINDLRAQLANLQVSARLLRSRDLALVAMQGGDPQPQAKGHILFDRDAGVWLLYVHDLKALRAGRTYQLWAITPDQQKHPAGTFDPDDAGLGVHRIELPKDLGQIALAAVTDEPRGGSPQPTGQIHIVGKLES